MQFPRVLVILAIVNTPLARASAVPLLVMLGTGFLLAAFILRLSRAKEGHPAPVEFGNPLRLAPALKFGVAFAAVLLLTRFAETHLGPAGVLWTSALGGSFSADAVVVSLSELLIDGRLGPGAAQIGIFLSLVANAGVKTGLAVYLGTLRFGWRMAFAFALMLGSGALAWWVL
jgi:uncharacterized membrane protein (DUF4010 family)